MAANHFCSGRSRSWNRVPAVGEKCRPHSAPRLPKFLAGLALAFDPVHRTVVAGDTADALRPADGNPVILPPPFQLETSLRVNTDSWFSSPVQPSPNYLPKNNSSSASLRNCQCSNSVLSSSHTYAAACVVQTNGRTPFLTVPLFMYRDAILSSTNGESRSRNLIGLGDKNSFSATRCISA